MKIKYITNESDYNAAIKRIKELIDSQFGSDEGEELESLIVLVTEYEDLYYTIEEVDDYGIN